MAFAAFVLILSCRLWPIIIFPLTLIFLYLSMPTLVLVYIIILFGNRRAVEKGV